LISAALPVSRETRREQAGAVLRSQMYFPPEDRDRPKRPCRVCGETSWYRDQAGDWLCNCGATPDTWPERNQDRNLISWRQPSAGAPPLTYCPHCGESRTEFSGDVWRCRGCREPLDQATRRTTPLSVQESQEAAS
jgi:ribosomal protein L37AE/L43A